MVLIRREGSLTSNIASQTAMEANQVLGRSMPLVKFLAPHHFLQPTMLGYNTCCFRFSKARRLLAVVACSQPHGWRSRKAIGDKSHSASASASAGGDADDWSFELDNLRFPYLFQHGYSSCPLLVMCCSVRFLAYVQPLIMRWILAPSRASPCRGGEECLLFQQSPVKIFPLSYKSLTHEPPSFHILPRSIRKGWSFSSTCTYS